MFDKATFDGRDVVARLFVHECLLLVALGRQMGSLKKPQLEKSIAALREDAAALADELKDKGLRDKAVAAIDDVLDQLRGHIEQLSS